MRRTPIAALMLSAVIVFGACSASLYNQAEDFERKGSYEQAVALYEQAAAENPGSEDAVKAQMKIGSIYQINLNQPEKAEAAYAAVAASAPGEEAGLEAQYQIGLIRHSAGDYDGAADAFRGILMEAPTSPQGGNAQLMLAQTYEEAGKLEEAQETYGAFSRLHTEDKNAVIALEKRAQLLDSLGKREEAIQQRQALVRDFGAQPEASDVVQLASEALVSAGAEVPTPVVQEEMSDSDARMERRDQRRERDRPRSQEQRSDSEKELSEEERLFGFNADHIMSALQIQPDGQGTMYDAMFSMASVLFTSGEYKQAGALYHRSLQMGTAEEGNGWESRAAAIKGVSDVYLKLGLEDRAKQVLSDAVRADNSIIDQVITQGEFEYGVGDYEKAVEIWTFVSGMSPGKDSQIFYLIGLAQRHMQNAPAEVAALERSVAANPRNLEAVQSLAEALYYRAGNRKRAFLYQDIIDEEADWPTYLEVGKLAMKYGYWPQASQQFNIGARTAAKAAERAVKAEDARAEKEAAEASIAMTALKHAARGSAVSANRADAAAEVNALTAGNPENAYTHFAAAHLAALEGENEKALSSYAKAMELEPRSAEFAEALAEFHLQNGDSAAAVEVYTAYLAKNPRDKRIQAVRDRLKADSAAAPQAAP